MEKIEDVGEKLICEFFLLKLWITICLFFILCCILLGLGFCKFLMLALLDEFFELVVRYSFELIDFDSGV